MKCYLLILEQNNIFFDYQFGFRKKRTATLAILDFVYRITDSIDGESTSTGVFLDLSKAFDPVNYDIILADKLSPGLIMTSIMKQRIGSVAI